MLQLLPIAQAGAVGGQGGPNNLQRFMAHHPPAFRGEGDPMVVDHWFRQVERVLEAMEITCNVTKIMLAIARRGKDPRVMGHLSPSHQWDTLRHSMFLLTLAWARGTDISPRVRHGHRLFGR